MLVCGSKVVSGSSRKATVAESVAIGLCQMPSPAAISGSLRILATEALSRPPPLVPAPTSLSSAQLQ